MNANDLTPYIRLIPLLIVIWSSIKHRDRLGFSIALLWAGAIIFATLLHMKYAGSILLTPLVFLVSWHIIKSHRR